MFQLCLLLYVCVAAVLGESFLKYMDAFFPVLLRGIADVANIQVSLPRAHQQSLCAVSI